MSYFVVKSLKKSYGKNLVLDDISFDIDKGQVLSIIGRSGCGKTTLLRSLNYLESIDDGKVSLEHELLLSNEFPKKENDIIKKRIHYGLVFQSFNLFPQYTVYQNIELPLKLMEEKRKKDNLPSLLDKPIDEEIMELLDKIGLQNKKDFYPSQLSGGQCQRVAIARAMALKPDILCFDEPTSALEEGCIIKEVSYVDNVKHGKEIFYALDGTVVQVVEYDHGEKYLH